MSLMAGLQTVDHLPTEYSSEEGNDKVKWVQTTPYVGSIPPAKVPWSKAVDPCDIQSCPPVVETSALNPCWGEDKKILLQV